MALDVDNMFFFNSRPDQAYLCHNGREWCDKLPKEEVGSLRLVRRHLEQAWNMAGATELHQS